MAKTSAIITYTDANGKAMQKTLTDINPEATNTEIKTFAQKMVGMTDNVYVQTDRVDKINCDTEASPVDTRPTPTLTVSNANFSCALNSIANTSLSYSGDGTIIFYDFVRVNVSNTSAACMVGHTPLSNNDPQVYVMPDKGFGSASGDSYSFKIGATETDNYKAPTPISCTFTIS